jgi:hypothetical protein
MDDRVIINSENLAPESLTGRIDTALGFARSSITYILLKKTTLDLSVYEATPDKFIAETALLLRSVIGLFECSTKAVHSKSLEIAEILAPHARSKRLALACLAHPGLSLDYLAPHIIMSSAGFPNQKFDGFLKIARSSTLTTCRERLPHRELEQSWLAYLSGETFSSEDKISATVLNHSLDVLFSSRDDIYAFTHALMYATDFGQKELIPTIEKETLASLAEGALVGALESDDFDLAGELLMTWPFLRINFSPIAAFCFDVLCSIEDQAGILPSFSLDQREYVSLTNDDDKSAYLTAAGYHTAYVMGLLCTGLLRAKTAIETSHGYPAVDFKTMELLDDSASKTPQWHLHFKRLNSTQQNEVLRFVFDAKIKKSAVILDMSGIRHSLTTYSKLSRPHGMLQLQAAQLMQRMSQAEFEFL